MNATKNKYSEANDILKNCFIQIGIEYAKLYSKDRAAFKKLFQECKSIRSMCQCVYWAYLKNGLIDEVLPEEGESKGRLIGRKILAVIKVISQ